MMTTVARRSGIGWHNMLRLGIGLVALGALAIPAGAQSAQPSSGIDSDLARPEGSVPPPPPTAAPPPAAVAPYPSAAPYPGSAPYQAAPNPGQPSPYAQPMADGSAALCGRRVPGDSPYQADDLIGAATNVFGSGARGIASVIRGILAKQGTPDGYIAGREAGGAFAVGLRYGSGTLCQRAQDALPVYWTGPSIGFDAGANAAKTFVLVYNLNNRDDLFRRFGAGEGQAYFVGGFNVSYLRRGNVVLIPVRLGVGLRLGINGGYMKITRHQNWIPF